MNVKKLICIGILIGLICGVPRAARAGSLGSDILSMFPKESGELAYADLKQARQFPWFTQLKEQMLPPKFREFETFLASAGIDPNSQVTELAWALVPGKATADTGSGSVPTSDQIVAAAVGQFQPPPAQTYFPSKNTPTV